MPPNDLVSGSAVRIPGELRAPPPPPPAPRGPVTWPPPTPTPTPTPRLAGPGRAGPHSAAPRSPRPARCSMPGDAAASGASALAESGLAAWVVRERKRVPWALVLKMLAVMEQSPDANHDPVQDFLSSGRTGRRNAMPDILGEHASTSTAELPARLQQLNTTTAGVSGEYRSAPTSPQPGPTRSCHSEDIILSVGIQRVEIIHRTNLRIMSLVSSER
ncbi:hypothetical protein R5R35_007466 [Gryllus longicercus]|uniref:Uncharacterized protein n=1 Tax=Gryllus longicercus TaxID=2509291 RepID=A0AAN9YZK1_9ORTH